SARRFASNKLEQNRLEQTGEKALKLFRTLTAAGFIAAAAAVPASALDISGAGATFPYPIYAKWADAYKKETGVGLNYQSIGSGGGIKQIKAKTVTFGASDAPLSGIRARRRRRLSPRLQARLRGHCVEAPRLAVCQRPHPSLAQVQEPGCAGGKARGEEELGRDRRRRRGGADFFHSECPRPPYNRAPIR